MTGREDAALRVGETLRALYARIHAQAMRDVPICNPALEVASIGFRPLGDFALGVMATPWFMNLTLAPLDPSDPPGCFDATRSGDSRAVRLPAGEFDFLAGRLDGFGPLWSCSLVSPMQDFADQEAMLAMAAAVMAEVTTAPPPPPEPPPPDTSRRAFLRGVIGARETGAPT